MAKLLRFPAQKLKDIAKAAFDNIPCKALFSQSKERVDKKSEAIEDVTSINPCDIDQAELKNAVKNDVEVIPETSS